MCIRDRYQEELETLRVKSNKSYTEKEHDNQMETKCQPLGSGLDPERIQNGSTLDPQYSIDPVSYTHLDVYKRQVPTRSEKVAAR